MKLAGKVLLVSARDPLDAGRSLLAVTVLRMPDWVVVLAALLAALTWQLRFLPANVRCTPAGLELIGQANYVKEVFVDSETAVGVISGVPLGTILPPASMAATRDLVNQLVKGKLGTPGIVPLAVVVIAGVVILIRGLPESGDASANPRASDE